MYVYLSGQYEVFDTNLNNRVEVELAISSEAPLNEQPITIIIPFYLAEVSKLPPGASYTYGFWGRPPAEMGRLELHLPADVGHCLIRLEGYLPGKSVLWRNSCLLYTSPSPRDRG